jgi:membrane associated rhomboid family serine protease
MDQQTLQFIRKLSFPLCFVGFIWIVHLVQVISGLHFVTLGVSPRDPEGLPGILTGPMIHGSWEHLFFNSVSFLIMGAIMFWFYPGIALRSIIWMYLLSGLGIWLIGERGSFHIGSSGVVYGMVSFVFWSGIFRRNVKSIVLALVVLVLYAGFFEGIVPGKEGISWEGHLMGGISGILMAWVYRKSIEADEIETIVEEEPEEKTYYLPRDTFEMTMEERKMKNEE